MFQYKPKVTCGKQIFFKNKQEVTYCINVFKLILYFNFCHEEEIKHFPVIITSIKIGVNCILKCFHMLIVKDVKNDLCAYNMSHSSNDF